MLDPGDGSSKAGPTPRESTADQLARDLDFAVKLNQVSASTLGIYGKELEALELVNREIVAQLTYAKELADIEASDLYEEEKNLEYKIAQAKLDKELIEIDRDRLTAAYELNKAKLDGLKPLEQEKAVLEALLNGAMKQQEEVEHALIREVALRDE